LVGQLTVSAVLLDRLIGGNDADFIGNLLLWLWIDLNRWVNDFLDLLDSLGVVVEIVDYLAAMDAEEFLCFIWQKLE
jgi:hypothetical protein